MDMTYEQWKAAEKEIKRRMSVPGWALLVYCAILNVSVAGFLIVESVYKIFQSLLSGDSVSIEDAVTQSAENAWGYFFAVAVGLLILLIWKKAWFFKEEIFAAGKPMKVGSFFTILCIFISGQLIFQLGASLLEVILNAFGYTIAEGLEMLQTDPDNFSMFLYAGILAPVAEELLFRGLIQRMMLPFGKKLAILASALTFGLFHGNLLQVPYAFLVGLVLGYVAAEYNILWAMVLHMINNLVLGDMLYRILGGFSDETINMVVWGIIFVISLIALVLVIIKRREIRAWLLREIMVGAYAKCYFTCAGTIAYLIIQGLNTLKTTFSLIMPL